MSFDCRSLMATAYKFSTPLLPNDHTLRRWSSSGRNKTPSNEHDYLIVQDVCM